MSTKLTQRQHTVKLAGDGPIESSAAASPSTVSAAFNVLLTQIFRLNGLLLAAGDALAEPAGQTGARWRVMAAIEDKPLTVAQIARVWGHARQSVQRVGDLLVEDGLAVYTENPRHRRAQLLALTPEGRTALAAIQATQRVWADRLGGEIGEADLRQASAILARVLRVVAQQGSQSTEARP